MSTQKNTKPEPEWFVYILRCGDASLYTGITTDLLERLLQHRMGKGAKYTRGRGPLRLIWWERVASKSAALKREYRIKALSAKEKQQFIRENRRLPL